MVIRRIGMGSAVKLFAVFYAAIGFIVGACIALFALVGLSLAPTGPDAPPAWLGSLFGAGAIIFLPIFYGAMGAVGGVLTAGVYNLVAGMVGGLELDVQ